MYRFGRNDEALRRHEDSLTIDEDHLLLDLHWVRKRVLDGQQLLSGLAHQGSHQDFLLRVGRVDHEVLN